MGKKLLVADDSITIQKVIKLALSSEGYEIIAVSGGKEAIQTIEVEKPDVVLLDVSLPGSDAYAVKRTINAMSTYKDVRFVVMFSAFEKVDEHAAEEVGFHGRLIKPFDPSNLRKIVSELMAQKPQSDTPPPPAATTAAPQASPPAAPLPPIPTPPPALPQYQQEQEQQQQQADDDLPPVQDMHPIVEAEEVSLSLDANEALELESPSRMLNLADLKKQQPPTQEPDTGSYSHTLDIQLPTSERTKFTERFEPVHQDPPASTVIEPPATLTKDLENDIRNLTDSTIRMTGLDAFSWNVDDSKKMKMPEAPAPAAAPGFIQAPTKPIDDGGSTFLSSGAPSPSPVSNAKPPLMSMQPPAPIKAAPNPALAPSPLPQVSTTPQGQAPQPVMTRAEMEALIRKDLEAVLEKIVREVVPRMAEDLLRKEIDKILSEP